MKILVLFLFCSFTQILTAKNLFSTSLMLNRDSLPTIERSAMVVEVNSEMLINKTQQFDIQLPNGINATVIFDRLQQHTSDQYSWFGHLKGQPQEHIFFSVNKGFYAGSLYTKAGVFEFTSAQKNHMRIAELATENFPECDGEETPVLSSDDLPFTQLQTQANSMGVIEFDVMVLYTPQARDAAGGKAAIEATSQAAVDAMNLSFINSQVNAQATLSYTGLANYNDSGDSGDDLSWVADDDNVAQLRTAYGADMVSLLVNTMGGCGRGFVMRNPGPGFSGAAFQVTRRSCAVGNLSFAHEFGHNMGLEHNPEDSSATTTTASNPWSFGHYHNNSYRTVMSYSAQCPNSCSRRQYFSNPDVQFNNLDSGIDGERDNARTLNQTASIIAAFRTPANDTIYEDDFE